MKTHCLQEGVGQFEPRFQGEGVVPWEYFLVSTKLDTFCYPTVVLRAVVLTQYRHVTDGQTDGIAIASAALAMRRAVKTLDQSINVEDNASLKISYPLRRCYYLLSSLNLTEALCFREGAGSPSNTKSPGLRPTSMPSAILMHPAVWPQ